MTTTSLQGLLNDQVESWVGTLVTAIKSDRPDLTNRQMALLMTVYIRPEPHTVRGLSARLHLSKPVVSRAIQLLADLGFVHCHKDRQDRRNIFIESSSAGAAYLFEFFSLTQPSSAPVETPFATPARLRPKWRLLRDKRQMSP